MFCRALLMYYFLHVLLIHLLAILGILIFGGEWKSMILTDDVLLTLSELWLFFNCNLFSLDWCDIIISYL